MLNTFISFSVNSVKSRCVPTWRGLSSENKLLFTSFLILFSGFYGINYSWDSTAAKFYPLAIGNVWSYHFVQYAQFSCLPYTSYDYTVRIDSIILKPNGKKYFKFSDGSLKRIDSVSMNVYVYLGNSECLSDSLLARKNDTIRVCASNPFPVVSDTAHVIFANADRRKMRIQQFTPGSFYHELVEGLGFYYQISCEGGGFHRSLNGCIINGIQYGNIIGIIQISMEIPLNFKIYQNYPNPFNPITKIKYQIVNNKDQRTSKIKITVFDITGKEIQTLVNEEQSAGTYEVDFSGYEYSSGVYFYSLIVDDKIYDTKRMVLLK